MAAKLQEELDTLTDQIKIEQNASPNNNTALEGSHNDSADQCTGVERREDGESGAQKPPPVATRATLEAEIRKQKAALDDALCDHRISDVRNFDRQIANLEGRRLFFPTSAQICANIKQLQVEILKVKELRDWDRWEALVGKIQELEVKLDLERAAEAETGISLGDEVNSTPSSSAIGGSSGEERGPSQRIEIRSCAEQKPNSKRQLTEAAKQMRSENTQEARNSSKASKKVQQQTLPGAHSIPGIFAESIANDEASVNTNLSDQQQALLEAQSIPGISAAVENSANDEANVNTNVSAHDSVQERIHQTLQNMAVPSHAEVVPDVENPQFSNSTSEHAASLTQHDERLLKCVVRLGLTITCMIVTVILVTGGVILLFVKLV